VLDEMVFRSFAIVSWVCSAGLSRLCRAIVDFDGGYIDTDLVGYKEGIAVLVQDYQELKGICQTETMTRDGPCAVACTKT